jgi:hypothetical protein
MANEGLIFPKLSERQKDLYLKVITNLQTYGYFDRSSGSNGVQYIDASNNPFKDQGQECYHCVFYYLEGNAPRCELIEGPIEPEAWCKFWIISEQDIKEESKAAFRLLNNKTKTYEITYNAKEVKNETTKIQNNR